MASEDSGKKKEARARMEVKKSRIERKTTPEAEERRYSIGGRKGKQFRRKKKKQKGSSQSAIEFKGREKKRGCVRQVRKKVVLERGEKLKKLL